jgi:hypothetical protein
MSSQATLSYQRQWTISILLALATFAVAMAWRKRKVARAATWLGTVSYSMYLLHPLVINVYARLPWLSDTDPLIVQAGLAAGCVALLLGCCWLTYRAVEAPMQRLGRRAAARLDARFGFDAAAVADMSAGGVVQLSGGARQHVPRGERVHETGRDRQAGEPARTDPARVGRIVAGREFSAGDGACVVTDVEHRARRPGPLDGSEQRAGRDP